MKLLILAVLVASAAVFTLPEPAATVQERCEIPEWPVDYPKPNVTIEHASNVVCQYGAPPKHERFGYTVCVEMTPNGCKVHEGLTVRGDRI